MAKRIVKVKPLPATAEAPVQKRARERKGPITFKVKLTEEQKQAKALALENDVVVFTGKPGTSKSLLACNIALDLLISGKVKEIIVTRPFVNVGKDIGFLPGDASSMTEGKAGVYLAPIVQAMFKLREQAEIEKMIEAGKIRVLPIQFVRGLNFEDCVVIIDESQNCTTDELKALTTRLCKDAKLIFTSDVNQIDLMNKFSSAGYFFKDIEDLPGVVLIELLQNFRSELALLIMDRINEYDERKDGERKTARLFAS